MSYIPGAPDFVNREFRELYPDGIAPSTPLVAASNGPPSPAPATSGGPPRPWQACLHGAVAGGFSLVLWPTATRPRARGGGASDRSCRPRHLPGSPDSPHPARGSLGRPRVAPPEVGIAGMKLDGDQAWNTVR